MSTSLRVHADSVDVTYEGAPTPAVRSVSLELHAAEVLVLLGPNGGGKTTLLKALAGLLAPSAGQLTGQGSTVKYVHQQAYMFRRSVRANLQLALRSLQIPRDEAEARMRAAADACHISDLLSRRATELSGGQQQRVALARALVREPDILLLDEPTANLDAGSRSLVRDIIRHRRGRGTSVVIATHDRDFAMACGDRFARMDYGRMEPVSINVLAGTVAEQQGELARVTVAGGMVIEGLSAEELSPGSPARVVFLPEDVVLAHAKVASSARNQLAMRVAERRDHFGGTDLRLDAGGVSLTARVSRESADRLDARVGSELYAAIKASSISMYTEAYEAAAWTIDQP